MKHESPLATIPVANPARLRIAARLAAILFAVTFGIFMGGCASSDSLEFANKPSPQPELQTLREGDVLKIAFPGSPNLDTTQTIRRDGRITLELVGDVVAAGMTPAELEKDLVQRYSTQLISKEVTVTVVSSSISVYVEGAVIRPGKIISDHPITALEAVMEAGGFDETKADMEHVRIVRTDPVTKKYTDYILDLKDVLDGKSTEPFYLKPDDVVRVKERFQVF